MITDQFFNILCDANLQQNAAVVCSTVYSLLEVREIQGQLLSKPDAIIEDKPLQIVIRDKDVAAGMTNFRNVMNLAASTPGTKTIAAMFSTNATDNLLCGRRGTIFKTLTAWGTSIVHAQHARKDPGTAVQADDQKPEESFRFQAGQHLIVKTKRNLSASAAFKIGASREGRSKDLGIVLVETHSVTVRTWRKLHTASKHTASQ